MNPYQFVTVWQIESPIEAVWDALYHSERWPEWWESVESVSGLQPADDDGLGGCRRYVWRGALPYRLTFDMTTTRLDELRLLEGQATGELQGIGRWELSQDGQLTTVHYFWSVATTKTWINILAPVARLLFDWNHEVVMRRGGEGLRRLLEGDAQTSTLASFDPDRLAYLECAGWRAYYQHHWPRAMWLLVELAHEQFALRWPRAFESAYHITRAMLAWAPSNNDPVQTERFIRRFYLIARHYGKGQHFDPEVAAALELNYWRVHRELAGRPADPKEPLEEALTELHSALFGLSREDARSSALDRARAAETVDRITSGRSTDVALDWCLVERYLRCCYRSIALHERGASAVLSTVVTDVPAAAPTDTSPTA